jgi:hypothetical protein
VYLLYLDESGTHTSSGVFVVAGIAVHEDDAWYLQRALTAVVARVIPPGERPEDFELHATEMKEPRRVRLNALRRGRVRQSPWEPIPANRRFWAMHETYRTLGGHTPQHAEWPPTTFGVVIDKSYPDFEERAYEEILHRFDEMLTRQAHEVEGRRQRGLVIHDKHVVERNVQAWVNRWRRVAGRIGVLTHMADVPLFADSRASRLLQAADFVSWAIWRYYAPSDPRWLGYLWPLFDGANGTMHGLVHVHRGFLSRRCACPPCESRALSSA